VCPIVAVKERLGPNIREAVRQQPRLAVVAKDAIEGLDVGIDGQLQRGVRAAVFRRIAEEILATESVEPMVPFCIRG